MTGLSLVALDGRIRYVVRGRWTSDAAEANRISVQVAALNLWLKRLSNTAAYAAYPVDNAKNSFEDKSPTDFARRPQMP